MATANDPIADLLTLQRDMDRLLTRFGAQPRKAGNNGHSFWMPMTDVFKQGEDMVVRLDLPGVTPADISVAVTGNMLTIKGERRQDQRVGDGDYVMRESSFGTFERRITMPQDIDAAKVHAQYRSGVLEVTIPDSALMTPQTQRVQVGGTQQQAMGTQQPMGAQPAQQSAMGAQPTMGAQTPMGAQPTMGAQAPMGAQPTQQPGTGTQPAQPYDTEARQPQPPAGEEAPQPAYEEQLRQYNEQQMGGGPQAPRSEVLGERSRSQTGGDEPAPQHTAPDVQGGWVMPQREQQAPAPRAAADAEGQHAEERHRSRLGNWLHSRDENR